jgi:hypothetical protein
MPSAIVTSTYRYKRPPRKKKPVLLEVPAIVKQKAEARPLASEPKASRPALVRGMKAGNDNRPTRPTPHGSVIDFVRRPDTAAASSPRCSSRMTFVYAGACPCNAR